MPTSGDGPADVKGSPEVHPLDKVDYPAYLHYQIVFDDLILSDEKVPLASGGLVKELQQLPLCEREVKNVNLEVLLPFPQGELVRCSVHFNYYYNYC